eukprot:g73383.t1
MNTTTVAQVQHTSWELATDARNNMSHLQGGMVEKQVFQQMYQQLMEISRTPNSLDALQQASLRNSLMLVKSICQMVTAHTGLWILSVVIELETWRRKHNCQYFDQQGKLLPKPWAEHAKIFQRHLIDLSAQNPGLNPPTNGCFIQKLDVGTSTWFPFFRSFLSLNEFQKTNQQLFIHMCFHLPLNNKTITSEWVSMIVKWMSVRMAAGAKCTNENYARLWNDIYQQLDTLCRRKSTIHADSIVLDTLATMHVEASTALAGSAADMGISAVTMEVRTQSRVGAKVETSTIVYDWQSMPWLDKVSAVDRGPDGQYLGVPKSKHAEIFKKKLIWSHGTRYVLKCKKRQHQGDIVLVELLESKALDLVMHKSTCGMSEKGLPAYHPAAVQLVPERLEGDYLCLGINVTPQHYLPLCLQRSMEDEPNAVVVLVRRAKNPEPRHERDSKPREVQRDRYHPWTVVDAKQVFTDMVQAAMANTSNTQVAETAASDFWQGLSLRVFPADDDIAVKSCGAYYKSMDTLRKAWKLCEENQQIGVAIMFTHDVTAGSEIVVQTDEKTREMMDALAGSGEDQHCLNLRDEQHREKLATLCSC